MMAVPPPDQVCILGQEVEDESPSPQCLQHCLSPTSVALQLESDDGIKCYGNEREQLTDQAKFYNNKLLSDVTLIVGNEKFHAHKLVLVRASEVFEKMFACETWDSHKEREVKLVEDSMCLGVFPRFLKFLYCCHIKLNINNTLPVLILADKYNVDDLRKVALDFACYYIIPKVQLKDVFHVWFQYATKCYHSRLTTACVQALALKMEEIINSDEWAHEWLSLGLDQLLEILSSSCLVVNDELDLWHAVANWLQFQKQEETLTEKQFKEAIKQISESVRFPMMTPEDLAQIEAHPLVEAYKEIFQPSLFLAYKYHALSLCSRARTKEFTTQPFLLRNYTNLRWDKRIVIPRLSQIQKGTEVNVRFATRSSSFPAHVWEWGLKIHPRGSTTNQEDLRIFLLSNGVLDQSRHVEYSLALVNSQQVLHCVGGRKSFSKARYSSDTEMERKVSVSDLLQPSSPFLVDDSLLLQISLKPAV